MFPVLVKREQCALQWRVYRTDRPWGVATDPRLLTLGDNNSWQNHCLPSPVRPAKPGSACATRQRSARSKLVPSAEAWSKSRRRPGGRLRRQSQSRLQPPQKNQRPRQHHPSQQKSHPTRPCRHPLRLRRTRDSRNRRRWSQRRRPSCHRLRRPGRNRVRWARRLWPPRQCPCHPLECRPRRCFGTSGFSWGRSRWPVWC
jgi:hypothetical protein